MNQELSTNANPTTAKIMAQDFPSPHHNPDAAARGLPDNVDCRPTSYYHTSLTPKILEDIGWRDNMIASARTSRRGPVGMALGLESRTVGGFIEDEMIHNCIAVQYPDIAHERDEFASAVIHHNWKAARIRLAWIEHLIAKNGGISSVRNRVMRCIVSHSGGYYDCLLYTSPSPRD